MLSDAVGVGLRSSAHEAARPSRPNVLPAAGEPQELHGDVEDAWCDSKPQPWRSSCSARAGSPVVTDASSSADSRPASSGIIETTLPNSPSLVLSVSNQSFADDPIGIVVTIDGREVVHDQFVVEDQHHWVTYELAVAPGFHAITLESDTGVTRTATFEVAAAKQRWAAISYWYDPPDRRGAAGPWSLGASSSSSSR